MFYNRTMRVVYREEPCRSALNRVKGMPFGWSLNPYMGCVHRCTFCYVRDFEHRAERPSGEAYGSSIRVKVNIAEVLRSELARPSWRGEEVVIGAATDPYQPAEGRYRLTQACIAALAAHRTPLGIITRSPLIIRDLDRLAAAAVSGGVSVTFSIPTLDEAVWRATEPGTAPPRQRLRALRLLVEAGIRTSVGMAPILPGISDRPEQLAEVVAAAREAGACGIWTRVLSLKPGSREHFMAALAASWPELVDEYERLFERRSSPPEQRSAPVRAAVARLADDYRIADRRVRPLVPSEQPRQLELGF
jgi:DNA repair photolyase